VISKFMDAVFGCWHTHYSFPMTVRGTRQGCMPSERTGTYVVCLDCGKEFGYDWKQMRVVSPDELANARTATLATKHAA